MKMIFKVEVTVVAPCYVIRFMFSRNENISFHKVASKPWNLRFHIFCIVSGSAIPAVC